MKKIYLLLIIPFFILGCEKEELIPQQEESFAPENQPYFEEIDFQDLPLSIISSFDEKDLNKSRENDSFPFGNIRRDMAAKKVVNEEGNVSYTMVLETVEKEFPKVNLLFILTILSFMKKTKEKT